MPKRGGDGDEDRGGGAEPERKENPTENGAETRTKRKLGFFFFFFYTRSAREEGNVDNAVRDGGGGISMVHRCGLKNLLMVKVRALEILKLRTTRNNPTKDRPTTRGKCQLSFLRAIKIILILHIRLINLKRTLSDLAGRP